MIAGLGVLAMLPERSLGDWGLLSVLVTFWGSAFFMIAIAVDTIPPFTISAVRLSLASLVLLGAMKIAGESLPPLFLRQTPGRPLNPVWFSLAGIGLIGNAFPFLLLAWSQTRLPSGIASIYLSFSPLTTLVLAHFFIREERMTRLSVSGFGLGFLGICLLAGPGAWSGLFVSDGALIYQIAVLSAAVCMGLSNIIAKRMKPVAPLGAATGLSLVAASITMPFAFIVDRPWALTPSAYSLTMVLLLGLLPTGLANVIFFVLIRRTGAVFLALVNYLTVPWAILMGIVLLGERPGWNALLAVVLILSGVAISQTPARRAARG